MSLSDFFRRIILHVALAGVVWFALAMLLEKMIPGFISPFIDLPDLALVLGAVGVAAILLHPSSKNRVGRLLSMIVSGFMLVIAAMLLWARVNDLGVSGMVLIGVVILLSVAFFSAHLSKKNETG